MGKVKTLKPIRNVQYCRTCPQKFLDLWKVLITRTFVGVDQLPRNEIWTLVPADTVYSEGSWGEFLLSKSVFREFFWKHIQL